MDLSRKKYRFIVCPIAMLGFFAHKLKSLPRKNRLTVYVGAFIFSEKEEGSILEITCKKVPLFFGQQLHLHKWAWQEAYKGGIFFTTIDLKCQKTNSNVRPLHSINKKYVMSFARHCNMEFVS